MKMKKTLSLLVVFCMVVSTALPVGATGELSEEPHSCEDPACVICNPAEPTETPEPTEPEAPQHIEGCADGCTAEGCECTCHSSTGEPPVEPTEPEAPQHIEGCADGCTAEGCECTCHTSTEEPPVEPTEPEAPQHIEGCADGCTAEGCECTCHSSAEEPPVEPLYGGMTASQLYNTLMSCTQLQAFDFVIDMLTEDELHNFCAALTDEQNAAIDAHLAALIEEYESIVPEEENPDQEPAEETGGAVNFTDAAPFVPPVTVTDRPATFKRSVARARTLSETDDGLSMSKKVAQDGENYKLTLESYATGKVTISGTEKAVPTDIVLVLDQSGSMASNIKSYSDTYTSIDSSARNLYNNYRNSLYIKVGEEYHKVTVTRNSEEVEKYTQCSGWSNSEFYFSRNPIYRKIGENNYEKINVSRGDFSLEGRVYTYSSSTSDWTKTSTGRDTVPPFAGELYTVTTSTVTTYTFSYTVDGVQVTETVADDSSSGPADWDLYTRESTNIPRLDALTNAVTQFVNAVEEKAKGEDATSGTADDVNHRIAMVGFSSGNYENTELLTGVEITEGTTYDNQFGGGSAPYYYPLYKRMNGVQYGSITTEQYANALQSIGTVAGKTSITNAINALTAHGGTRTLHGLDMADQIFANDTLGGKRNRVVILFTDGDTDSGRTETIDKAHSLKSTRGATVYSVGILDGADGTPPITSNTSSANKFLHLVSSNYPSATSWDNMGDLNSSLMENGVLNGKSYYLSASDTDALNNIFQTISDNIESGSTSVTLDEKAVVKDVIAESFELPANTTVNDINAYIVDYAGNGTWSAASQPVAKSDISIAADGRTVSVTGFDFAGNYVWDNAEASSKFGGQKLVIEIPIKVRDGFWGGNNVVTNGEGSGIYENAGADTSVKDFVSPNVNVEINPEIATHDKSVYLTQSFSETDLYDIPTAPDADAWKTAYVQVTPDKTVVTSPTEDATYDFIFAVKPTSNGEGADLGTANPADGVTRTGTSHVYVFKPTVTWQDTRREVGSSLSGFSQAPFGSVEWTHPTPGAPTPAGTAPTLTYTFTLDGNPALMPGANVLVDVTVHAGKDITGQTTFAWAAGGEGCADTTGPGGGFEFRIHPNTVSLTITKTVEGSIEQSFLFTVTGPNNYSATVVITPADFGSGKTASVTLNGLVPGSYTVTEDTSWSWRYTCGDAQQTVNLADAANTVFFTNTYSNDNWLGGDGEAKNDFKSIATTARAVETTLPPDGTKESKGGEQA